jgi:histidinol-phosphate aminotransferase
MSHLSRRDWLKRAGAGGALALASKLGAFAYAPAPASRPAEGPVRLHLNENPYGPAPSIRKAWEEGFAQMHRYPYEDMQALAALLAQRHGVPPQSIVLTVGSGEGLKAAGLAYGLHGGEIIAAQPTFHLLMEYAAQFGAYIHHVPLDAELDHDLDAMARRITQRTSLIFVCNPNNPSGSLLPAGQMRGFCARLAEKTVVFADEAYFDYIAEPGYPSMIELVKEGMNVIVSRTFSKVYGMAGIRVGYLIARPDIAARLRQHTMASVSIPALVAARAALEDEAFCRFSLEKNREALGILCRALDERGLRYVPSHANFVFFEAGRPVREVQAAFEERGFLVGRPFPPFDTWCRVSTGRVEDIEAFARALKKVF